MHSEGRQHFVHIAVAVVAIVLGLVVAFNYSGTANAALGPGSVMCQGKKTSCLEREKKNPKKDEVCKKEVEAISCKDKDCTGKCEYGSGLCKGNPSTCPQGKGDTKPKEEKKPEEKKGGEGGKPPELPKLPEPKPKPPEEKKKEEECIAQGKSPAQCEKETCLARGVLSPEQCDKEIGSVNSGLSGLFDNLTDAGSAAVKTGGEILSGAAQKLLDSLGGTPAPTNQDNPTNTSGNTGGTNPDLPKGNTGNTNSNFDPFGKSVGGSSAGGGFPKGGGVTGFGPPPSTGSQASLQAQIQSLWQRIQYLFSLLGWGF